MTITICGSVYFLEEMQLLMADLKGLGYVAMMPSLEGREGYDSLNWSDKVKTKTGFVDKHLNKIRRSDAILVANYPKKGIENYIGANTFLEIGFAYCLGKKIFILNDIPEQDNRLEIESMKPVVLTGTLSNLTV